VHCGSEEHGRGVALETKFGLMGLHARTDYTKGSLNENELPSDPWVLLTAWLDEAVGSGMQDPTAFALSTMDELGYPHSRIVLLRDTRQGSWCFSPTTKAKKGKTWRGTQRQGQRFSGRAWNVKSVSGAA